MNAISAPTIDELQLADDPARWAALGFDVRDGVCQIATVRLRFADPSNTSQARGIVGWSLRDLTDAALSPEGELNGLPTTISQRPLPAPAPAHPNGVTAIDHVVAASPDLDRSVAALQAAGLDLRRVREQPTPAGAPRQAFFRLGEAILEVVQEPYELAERGGGERPARLWGLALLSADLERTVDAFGEHAGDPRDAVQPGRRIVTVRRSSGLAVPLAVMSARPSR